MGCNQNKTDYQSEYYEPVLGAAMAILNGAYKHRTVKRLVFTGSINDLVPPTAELTKGFEGYVYSGTLHALSRDLS